jgi:chromosome segregation ATPase
MCHLVIPCRLESAVVASRRRCDALDVALSRKADVSVLAEIEAAAATVEQERDSIQQLREGQEVASTKIAALEHGLHAEVARGEDVLTVLESVSTQLASKATQADMDTELASVRLALEAAKASLQDSINQIETHQDTDESQMQDLHQQLDDHQARLDAQRTAMHALATDIGARPLSDECWPRERGEATELGVTRLRDALRSRASSEAVTAAQSTLDGMKRQLSVAESRIAVALEFVEWYAAKGAGLEHNTRVVDDHLRKMATEGVAQTAARQAAAAATA